MDSGVCVGFCSTPDKLVFFAKLFEKQTERTRDVTLAHSGMCFFTEMQSNGGDKVLLNSWEIVGESIYSSQLLSLHPCSRTFSHTDGTGNRL